MVNRRRLRRWGRLPRLRPLRQRLAAAGAVWLLAGAAVHGAPSALNAATAAPASAGAVVGNSMTRPALPSRLAERSVLLDVAAAGNRLVAVGERGRVLLSDDAGQTWRQSLQVPVSVTLTALTFVDAREGWAVGHAGVVLHTTDAGEHWVLQLDGVTAARQAVAFAASRPDDAALKRSADLLVADGPDKPFLAVQFRSATSGLAVGAYGLIFSTDDGGASWQPRMADVENPKGLHFNAVHFNGPQTYIAGERGLLLRSDGGRRFNALPSPYDGSWFAVDASHERGITLAGLRGNVFNSRDDCASWQKVEGVGGQTFSAVRPVGDKLLLASQSGAIYALDARLHSTPLDVRLPPAPVTALLAAGDGALVATTLRGPVRLSAAPAASGAAR